MLFSVVVSIDAPRRPARYVSRALRRSLGGAVSDSEYRYLAREGSPEWARARSWGGSAILTRAQFERLLSDTGAYATDTPTMGTLGGPLGLGIVPDIAFESDGDPYDAGDLIFTMRATPIPEFGRVDSERAFVRLWRAAIRQFGGGVAGHFSRVPLAGRLAWHRRQAGALQGGPNGRERRRRWSHGWGPGYAYRARFELARARRRRPELYPETAPAASKGGS